MIMMKSISQNNSSANAPGLWRELYTIFLFYLKIFLGTLLFGSIFFFLYAGIKTGNIPLDIVAVGFSIPLTILVTVLFAYIVRLLMMFLIRKSSIVEQKSKESSIDLDN